MRSVIAPSPNPLAAHPQLRLAPAHAQDASPNFPHSPQAKETKSVSAHSKQRVHSRRCVTLCRNPGFTGLSASSTSRAPAGEPFLIFSQPKEKKPLISRPRVPNTMRHQAPRPENRVSFPRFPRPLNHIRQLSHSYTLKNT